MLIWLAFRVADAGLLGSTNLPETEAWLESFGFRCHGQQLWEGMSILDGRFPLSQTPKSG
ncbi:MAG: hypothetical protein ACOH5I_18110 [Oligoflexus sp.]